MPERFKNKQKKLLNQLIGLGPDSMQKSYYPELMSKVQELKRFRDMLDHINDLLLLVELPEGRIFDLNKTAASVLGYESEEMRGMHLSDLFDEEMGKKVNAHLFTSNNAGGVLEVDIRHKNGDFISAQLNTTVVQENEEHLGILVIRDITESVQTRNALVRQRAYFEQLFANAPVGIALLDKKGKVLDVNACFEEMFGYIREELIGNDVDLLLASGDMMEEARNFTRKVDSGEKVSGETWRTRKDGELVRVNLQGFPIYFQGEVSGVIGLYEDISEKKRLEQEMVKSQKLESIALLAGGIAHDFNNLVSGLMANLSMVRFYEKNNKQVLDVLTKAENACLRARDMTQQLLTFSKGGEPVRNVFYLQGPLQQTVDFALSGSNVLCKMDIDEDLRPLFADQGQINQVIQNLVINADQAMAGGGELIIRARNIDLDKGTVLPLEPGKYVLLIVSDNGAGINQQYLDRIFDPYFSTKDEGSGLGLAIVFSIVNKHGGWIQVFSEPGQGTDFYIYLPATEREEEEKLCAETDKEWTKARILFMDDEKDLAEATSNLLREIGYEVTTVYNGREVMDEYSRQLNSGEPYDVVVMDLTVPGNMGGRETLRELLRIHPDVRAIASSGYSNDPVMARFSDYGFQAALPKPYKIEELDRVTQEVLKKG